MDDYGYARIRHPEYVGFVRVVIGFLLHWPTFATLLMFPIILVVYQRLARSEERGVRSRLDGAWDAYASVTPRFWARYRPRRRSSALPHQ